MIHVSPRNHRTLIGGQMSNSCQCCKRYWTHLHGKVRCFVTHMDRHSRHRMVIPERFVNYFAWKLSAAIELEAPNGNVYDVGITERRNKTLLRSGWEAFVDDNHIVEGDSLMFRYCGNCCFKVVVFDSSGCEKVVSCARSRRQININDQEPSTNSADISTSFSDGSTHSSARGRSVDWQSGTLGHCRKRARTDAISSPSDDFSEDSPYEHESSESDDQMLATPLYVLSGKCYVTEEDEANIVELVREIQPEMPLLVAMMMKPSLKPYPDLVIPKDYALAHFPRKNQTIKLQLPEQSNKWHCEFRVKSDGGRCNLKECGFVRDNNLLEGDLCVFQPMTNRKGRTFKLMVHLLRKVTIDHPSGENLSTYGLPSTKNAPTLCIKEEPNDGEDSFGESWSHCIRSAHLCRSHDQDQCPCRSNLCHTIRCQVPPKWEPEFRASAGGEEPKMAWRDARQERCLEDKWRLDFFCQRQRPAGGGHLPLRADEKQGGTEEDDGLHHLQRIASLMPLTGNRHVSTLCASICIYSRGLFVAFVFWKSKLWVRPFAGVRTIALCMAN
ncbi:B3 domain-containing protein Os03g0619600-like isoform X2 [Hordeum vulgare subsp. vulgare]|uniref:B3 domain-containing protein Os03g0619600-like isoform X2 n=1 Tax=Hordeum vulgare subsp. vulgare TaxID=112509 RepID=UPI000B46C535|nr:B3 domain-containing protein Os03g0619600-like isoform X2 [Hordeum vulgare subsp. vulgare]